jgi:hypothetical protein
MVVGWGLGLRGTKSSGNRAGAGVCVGDVEQRRLRLGRVARGGVLGWVSALAVSRTGVSFPVSTINV